MSCIIKTITNSKPSNLYDKILNGIAKGNETMADRLYAHFLTNQSFIEDFGNYMVDYKHGLTNDRVDENGEPILFEDNNGGFYYINKNNVHKPFPVDARGLRGKIPAVELTPLINSLAIHYLMDKGGMSFTDVSLSENIDGTLTEYINDRLASRLAEVEANSGSRDVSLMKAKMYVPILMEHVDELNALIRNHYNTMNLGLVESVDDDLNIQEESGRDHNFSKASFESSVKSNVRTNTKLRLSMVPNSNDNRVDALGHPAYLTFDQVWGSLMNELVNIFVQKEADGINLTDGVKTMVDILDNYANTRKEFRELANLVKKAHESKDPFERNAALEMYQAFNNIKNKFVVTDFTDNGKTVTHNVKDISQQTTASSNVRQTWNTNFVENVVLNGTKDTVGDRVSGIKDKINDLVRFTSEQNNNELFISKDGMEAPIDTINRLLTDLLEEMVGYKLDNRAINRLLETRTKGVTQIGYINWITKKLQADFNKATSSKKIEAAFKKEDNSHSLITNSDALFKIAEAEAFFNNAADTRSVNAISGTAYTISNKNHISTQINEWKTNPQSLVHLINTNKYASRSVWANYLLAMDVEETAIEKNSGEKTMRQLESEKRMSNFGSSLFLDYYAEVEGKHGIEELNNPNKDVDKQLYMIDYLNKVLKPVNELYTVKTIVPADKNTDIQLTIGKTFKGNIEDFNENQENKISFVKKDGKSAVIDTFSKYFYSEIERMREAELQFRVVEGRVEELKKKGLSFEQIRNTGVFDNMVVHYHFNMSSFNKGKFERGNAFKSQYFPALSPNYKGVYMTEAHESLANEVREALFNEKGQLHDVILNESAKKILPGLKGGNGIEIEGIVNMYMEHVLSENIVNTHTKMINNGLLTYNKGVLVKSKLDARTKLEYDTRYNTETKQLSGMAMAADFYINSVVRQIEFSKLFTGDIAYYKNTLDYKKRIPATYTDGIVPVTRKGSYNVAVVDSVVVKEYLNFNRLAETVGVSVASKFVGTNQADGQALITPARWRSLQEGISWTQLHESAWKKMMGYNKEGFTPEELKLAAQPLKGVYFWINNGVPTFLKYSQAVLIPGLTKGTELDRVLQQMDEQGIEELVTFDGIKVGAHTPTKIHNPDGTVISGDIRFNKMVLDNRGWKLQQDLPTKGMHDTEVGSQIQKNIYFGLKHNPNLKLTVDGVEMTAQDVVNKISDNIKRTSDRGLKKLFKRFGFDESGQIKNEEAFFDALVSDIKSRGGSLNVLDALEKRLTLYGVPQVRSKIAQMFSSQITKSVIKMKTNGGSFIQMSNFGLSYDEASAENSGIKLHPRLKQMSTSDHVDDIANQKQALFVNLKSADKERILSEHNDVSDSTPIFITPEGKLTVIANGNKEYKKARLTTFEPYVYTKVNDNAVKYIDLTSEQKQNINLDTLFNDVINDSTKFNNFVEELINNNTIDREC